MVLLTHKLKPQRPKITVLVQFAAVALAAFPHGYVSIISGFSLWPSTIMHFLWNRINPVLLGSIYTQTSGYIIGQQWKINGEGLMGCIIGVPFALFFCWQLSAS